MATKQGIERADVMNMIALLLPGVTLTYQVLLNSNNGIIYD